MDQQRNLIVAVALSIAILIGFQYFLPKAKTPAPETAQHGQAEHPAPGQNPSQAPGSPASNMTAPTAPTRAEALAAGPRIKIDTPSLQGSIDLAGAQLDDLNLSNYRETIDPNSPPIQLLSPAGSPEPYFVDYGWVSTPDEHVKLPDATSRWQTSDAALTPDRPVTLSWDNGEGLRFTRRYAVDDNYMFTVTQGVENKGAAPVTLYAYGLISRGGKTPKQTNRLLHVGPVGVIAGKLCDGGSFIDHDHCNYDDIKTAPLKNESTGGWLGFTDEYWLTALVPDQQEALTTKFTYHDDEFQADFTGAAHAIPVGGSTSETTRLFAGAKEVHLLDSYEDQYNIPRLDRAIDFGWFYFLTKPIFLVLDFFYRHIGNFGLAILALTIIVKLLFFPLANRSYRSMSKMKLLQPEMAKLRERMGDDKARLNQEMMALYKRSGANPAAGCLPIVIQIPVFFSLYKVLSVTIEMRHAPFFGWIHDLSVPDPTTILNLFGLLPFAPPDIPFLSFVSIGAWPIMMGVTMFVQQKLTPAPPDPTQARMMMLLPVVFTFMLAHFPAGLVIYWAWNNTLTIAQQWLIMRQSGVKRPAKA